MLPPPLEKKGVRGNPKVEAAAGKRACLPREERDPRGVGKCQRQRGLKPGARARFHTLEATVNTNAACDTACTETARTVGAEKVTTHR